MVVSFARANRRLSSFTLQDLTITINSLRTPYRRRTHENKTALHWGQRKLLLSEVEFFSIYWDALKIPNPICVYAGAAPGTHILLLSEMFPSFTFHLYDPSPFTIKASPKIQLFNEYFTDDVADRYSGRKDIFFLSDIRTADYKLFQRESLASRGITQFDDNRLPIGPYDLVVAATKESDMKTEDQIWGDMNMQQTWINRINPEHALLKFRLPYVQSGTDRVVPYLRGVVYWQVWSPQTSTETRLKPVRNSSGIYDLAEWSTLEYEEWCIHHNTISRQETSYVNIFTGTDEPIDSPELLNDYDSVAESTILKLYLEKFGTKNVYQQTKKLSHLITWSLNGRRKEDQLTGTLATRRAAPVKSTNKGAVDAFRSKRKGVPAPEHTAVVHTKVDINQTWRQSATIIQTVVAPKFQRSPATAIVPQIQQVAVIPQRSPPIQITATPIVPQIQSVTPTPIVPQLQQVTATHIVSQLQQIPTVIVPQLQRSPAVSQINPLVQQIPTVIVPQLQRSPAVSQINPTVIVPQLQRSPAVQIPNLLGQSKFPLLPSINRI